jgi:putative DNA primase/helicase
MAAGTTGLGWRAPNFGVIARALRKLFPNAPIVPCGPDKKPLVAWKPFQNGMTDEQLEELIRRFPYANAAIITGRASGLFVLDIDGPVGVVAFAELCGDPGGPRVHTRGYADDVHVHRYFIFPPDLEIRNAAKLLPGCDWRGEGGYAIAAGSVRADGTEYVWFIEPGDATLGPIPPALLDLIRKQAAKAHKTTSTNGARPAGDGISPYAQRALDAECERVRNAARGTQSQTLISAAFSLGTLVGGNALPESLTRDALLDAALAMEGEPDVEKIRDHVERGIRNGAAHPRSVPERPGTPWEPSSPEAFGMGIDDDGNFFQVGENVPAVIDDGTPTLREIDPPAPYSDVTLSNQFANEYGPDLRFVSSINAWFLYREVEGRWAEDDRLFVWTLCKRFLTAVSREAYALVYDAIIRESGVSEDTKRDAARQAKGVASALTSAAKVANVLNLARSHPIIAATLAQFDRDPWLLNTPIGVVNLVDGSLRPARRDDYFTKITKVAPRDMPTPLWDRFRREIMGALLPPDVCPCAGCIKSKGKPPLERKAAHDKENELLAAYIERPYGYAISGDVSAHVLFLELGRGGNGKGVLNDLISQDVLGLVPDGYATEIPMEALTESKGERHPTELMVLWGARLALARESDEATRWNEGRVKKLTGGDPVQARRMRQDFVTFDATHKLIVFGNVKPILRGADQDAWRRRLHLITFPQRWAEKADDDDHVRKADDSIRKQLAAEAPGILHRLIKAGIARRNSGFDAPATVREATKLYLAEENAIAQWAAERLDLSDKAATSTVNQLWADLTGWAEPRHEWIGRRKHFPDRLEALGIHIDRNKHQRGLVRGAKLLGAPAAAQGDLYDEKKEGL